MEEFNLELVTFICDYYYMNHNKQGDFQICISVTLTEPQLTGCLTELTENQALYFFIIVLFIYFTVFELVLTM